MAKATAAPANSAPKSAAKAEKPGTAAQQTKQAAPPTSEVADAEGWTNSQQSAMEAAMKKFPGTMPAKERWIAIAELVEGKTAKDCFARFKSIVAKLKAESQNN